MISAVTVLPAHPAYIC